MQLFDKLSSVSLILTELQATSADVLAALAPALWDSYADKALIAPRLQYLYTRRQCLTIRLGTRADQITWEEAGTSESVSDQYKNWSAMLSATNTEIEQIETRARSNRAVIVTPITQISPSPPAPNAPDPSGEQYRGSPYFSRRPVS